jgi:hypothetical protein
LLSSVTVWMGCFEAAGGWLMTGPVASYEFSVKIAHA